MNQTCSSSLKKKWFSDLVGPDDGSLIGSHNSCNRKLFPGPRVSGFRAKESREIAVMVAERMQSRCQGRTIFLQHEAWMEKFSLAGLSITPASLLLNFCCKQRTNIKEGSTVDDTHGILCLFSFSTKEYFYHWYVDCYLQYSLVQYVVHYVCRLYITVTDTSTDFFFFFGISHYSVCH